VFKLGLVKQPQWIVFVLRQIVDDKEVENVVLVKLRPLTTSLLVAARSDPEVANLPAGATAEQAALALAKALARRAILEWKGLGDEDGNPIEPTPEAINDLLDYWPAFEAFQSQYVSKGLLLESEKNGSLLSRSGISAGATDTAQPAEQTVPTAPPE
jgi:hypothetical protein